MVLNEKRTRIVVPSLNTEADIIVPKTREKSSIVKHIYQIYKGEGARKLTEWINIRYSGISKEFIQQWPNNNIFEDYLYLQISHHCSLLLQIQLNLKYLLLHKYYTKCYKIRLGRIL